MFTMLSVNDIEFTHMYTHTHIAIKGHTEIYNIKVLFWEEFGNNVQGEKMAGINSLLYF